MSPATTSALSCACWSAPGPRVSSSPAPRRARSPSPPPTVPCSSSSRSPPAPRPRCSSSPSCQSRSTEAGFLQRAVIGGEARLRQEEPLDVLAHHRDGDLGRVVLVLLEFDDGGD